MIRRWYNMYLINSAFFKPGTFFVVVVLINCNIHRGLPSLSFLFFYFTMSTEFYFSKIQNFQVNRKETNHHHQQQKAERKVFQDEKESNKAEFKSWLGHVLSVQPQISSPVCLGLFCFHLSNGDSDKKISKCSQRTT